MVTKLLIVFLSSIGAVCVVRFLFWVTQFVSLHFWIPTHPLRVYKRIDGDTFALITGSSAGIGLGIARALVRQGFSVILLGHLSDELATAAQSLITSNNIPPSRVRTLVLDARTATHEEISSAVDSISNLPVSILVNNVGGIPMAHRFKPLSAVTLDEVDAHVDLNSRFMARLTKALLPVLKRQNRSLIINLSSPAKMGVPWIVMYSATKAFNYAFSAALARELKYDPSTAHIDCLAILPGDTRTQSNVDTPEWAVDSYEFGAAVVDTVDTAVARHCVELMPNWRDDLARGILEVFPERVLLYLAAENVRGKKEREDRVFTEKKHS